MKVKNISVKPICIGSISLLPGETAQVDTTYDAMAFYISMGLLQEVQEKKARGKNVKNDSEADAPADAPAGGES